MDHPLLMGVVLPVLLVLGVEPGAAEIGGGGDGGTVVAAFDDGDVEVGAGDGHRLQQ